MEVGNMKRFLACIISVTMSLTAIEASEAFVTYGRWAGNNVSMRAAGVSFPAGNPYRRALQAVVDRFYQNPSQQWFTQLYDDPSVGRGNGESETWFSSDPAYSPAVTYWWMSNGYIVETDVIFYNGVAYTPYMTKTSLWPYGGAYRPFQTTAIHEYGHAAGLLHEDGEYNIMGQDYTFLTTNGQTCRSYVGEDASDGLVSLYGLANPAVIEDLSVTLFKWVGWSGEYSWHDKGKMFNTSNVELPSTNFNGQRRYNVNKGQRVKAEFTWENNGETTQNRTAGWYISTNSTIDTSDRRIATQNYTLSRDDPYTIGTTITIPSNLTSGQTYYLGVIIDYNNRLSEVAESNNAAYHIIRVN
jgi:hypothetical protein